MGAAGVALAVPAIMAIVGGGTAATLNQAKQQQKGLENAMETQKAQQLRMSEQAQKDLLQKPKQVSPDNFLAIKSRNLANLRLGLASTMTGGGGLPSPVLSAPSLIPGGGGKSKLGA